MGWFGELTYSSRKEDDWCEVGRAPAGDTTQPCGVGLDSDASTQVSREQRAKSNLRKYRAKYGQTHETKLLERVCEEHGAAFAVLWRLAPDQSVAVASQYNCPRALKAYHAAGLDTLFNGRNFSSEQRACLGQRADVDDVFYNNTGSSLLSKKERFTAESTRFTFQPGEAEPGRVIQSGKSECVSNVQLLQPADFPRLEAAKRCGVVALRVMARGGNCAIEVGTCQLYNNGKFRPGSKLKSSPATHQTLWPEARLPADAAVGCVSCVPMLWRGRASSSRILNDPSLDFCPEGSVTAQGGRDCTGPVAASQNKEAVDDRDNSNDAGNNTQNISNKDDDSHLTREREPEEWGGREEQDRWVTTAIAGGGDEYESSANRNRPAVSAHPSKSNRTNAQNRNRNRSRNNGHISNINSAKATYQVIDPTRQAVEGALHGDNQCSSSVVGTWADVNSTTRESTNSHGSHMGESSLRSIHSLKKPAPIESLLVCEEDIPENW